ncbi:putative MmpL efflux pump [Paratrimastix pyriformis]|uniref:MmpL efflux pump n=1 Tax=Paratrimastix pyriformis TaxID=342808 RepID=A0ABQ8UPD5_9EUKA|nr:putative MmpL efflux pump [Paratrimastix pyriformis]
MQNLAGATKISWFDRFFRVLHRGRLFVLLFWVVVLGFGAAFGPRVMNMCHESFTAPAGSPTDIAKHIWASIFPEQSNTSDAVVFISTSRPDSLFPSESIKNNITEAISHHLSEILWSHPMVTTVLGYYLLNDTLAEAMYEDQFISPNKTSTLIVVQTDIRLGDQDAFISWAEAKLRTIDIPSGWSLMLLGEAVLGHASHDAAVSSMVSMDSIILPTALAFLAILIRNLRMMLIPIACLGLSILTSFLLMIPVAMFTNVSDFGPNIMMSILIALSIDYSLFLLSRFREEMVKSADPIYSVHEMTLHAGRVVLVSGAALALTFVGLCFFPIESIRSLGLGCAIALLAALSINLTLTPALLLTFPRFFAEFRWLGMGCLFPCCPPCRRERRMRKLAEGSIQEGPVKAETEESALLHGSTRPPVEAALGSGGRGHAMTLAELTARQQRSYWFRCGSLTARQQRSDWFRCGSLFLRSRPRAALAALAVVVLTAALGLWLKDLRVTFEHYQGRITPFHIIVDTGAPGGALTPTYWDFATRFVTELPRNLSGIATASFVTISVFKEPIPYEWVEEFVIDPSAPLYNETIAVYYREFIRRYTSADRRYVVMDHPI